MQLYVASVILLIALIMELNHKGISNEKLLSLEEIPLPQLSHEDSTLLAKNISIDINQLNSISHEMMSSGGFLDRKDHEQKKEQEALTLFTQCSQMSNLLDRMDSLTLTNQGSYIYSLPKHGSTLSNLWEPVINHKVFHIEEDENSHILDQQLLHLMQMFNCDWKVISAFFMTDQREMAFKHFMKLKGKQRSNMVSITTSPIEVLRRQKLILESCLFQMNSMMGKKQ